MLVIWLGHVLYSLKRWKYNRQVVPWKDFMLKPRNRTKERLKQCDDLYIDVNTNYKVIEMWNIFSYVMIFICDFCWILDGPKSI